MTESQMNRQPLRFVLDGKIITAGNVAPTTTLLQYLRETLGRIGTKEGCAEGDCGACTIVEGELCGDNIEYRAVNSCIRFLPTFDGKEIVTVESLKAPTGELHPVQQAMVDCHASQCGFCTPGFVMSLLALYLKAKSKAKPEAKKAQDSAHDRNDIVEALSGNLCRCTGYRPIIDAAVRMTELPDPVAWSRNDAQSEKRRALLATIARTDSLVINSFTIEASNATHAPAYVAPRTLDELATRYQQYPQSLLLAGATDIGLWVTKQMRDLPPLIYIGDVDGLDRIEESADVLEIGASVKLGKAYDAICVHYPALQELAMRFASTPIRNSGTFCGNIANGSPIGDSMPFLLALDASLVLQCGDSIRNLPLEQFYLGYQKKALLPGEFIVAVRIPLIQSQPAQDAGKNRSIVASYKISKRFDQDISAVCGGYALDIKDDQIVAVRIAYGGMAAIPQRARNTEAALIGQPWSSTTFKLAQQAIALDYQPLSDMRASAAYRLQVAANLLMRLYLEKSQEKNLALAMRIPAISETLLGLPS